MVSRTNKPSLYLESCFCVRDLILRHNRTASDVLSAVKAAMSKYGTNSVTPVGHSFGESCQSSMTYDSSSAFSIYRMVIRCTQELRSLSWMRFTFV